MLVGWCSSCARLAFVLCLHPTHVLLRLRASMMMKQVSEPDWPGFRIIRRPYYGHCVCASVCTSVCSQKLLNYSGSSRRFVVLLLLWKQNFWLSADEWLLTTFWRSNTILSERLIVKAEKLSARSSDWHPEFFTIYRKHSNESENTWCDGRTFHFQSLANFSFATL